MTSTTTVFPDDPAHHLPDRAVTAATSAFSVTTSTFMVVSSMTVWPTILMSSPDRRCRDDDPAFIFPTDDH
jgi:hypothetical protein